MIDPSFDFYSDTPDGKDPDIHSPTLRRYHQLLWSKKLPNGTKLDLSMTPSTYLEGCSMVFSSDAISNSYRHTKRIAHIVNASKEDSDRLFTTGSQIGGYIIFPSNRVHRKPTINGARGMNPRIADRFDLTLECIKRHYHSESSPLSDVLARYKTFFDAFVSFKEYVNFFLLKDFVTPDYEVKFFLPFNNFHTNGLPQSTKAYTEYSWAATNCLKARTARIGEWAKRNLGFQI